MLLTLVTPFTLIETIKKSRFIVNAAPINSIDDAAIFINQVSELNASHNCWAWKLGQQYRFSDDGEPTSTAGHPILTAIEGQHCDHVIIVVTRYFGGIKLGTGGLIRAYGGSASRCLQKAELMPIISRISCRVTCFYSEWAILENKLKEIDTIIESQTFDDKGTSLEIAIIKEHLSSLSLFMANLTRGRETIELKS